MNPFDRLLVSLAATFAVLAWLAARRTAERASASDALDVRGHHRPREVRLKASNRGGDWPHPSWN